LGSGLKLAQPLRHRGLGDAQAARGRANAAFCGQGGEIAKLLHFHRKTLWAGNRMRQAKPFFD
jgi:hypothetical protein